jgi:hypothetical protein
MFPVSAIAQRALAKWVSQKKHTSEAQLNGIEFDRHCGVETTEFLSNGKVTLLRWMLSAVVYNS